MSVSDSSSKTSFPVSESSAPADSSAVICFFIFAGGNNTQNVLYIAVYSSNLYLCYTVLVFKKECGIHPRTTENEVFSGIKDNSLSANIFLYQKHIIFLFAEKDCPGLKSREFSRNNLYSVTRLCLCRPVRRTMRNLRRPVRKRSTVCNVPVRYL